MVVTSPLSWVFPFALVVKEDKALVVPTSPLNRVFPAALTVKDCSPLFSAFTVELAVIFVPSRVVSVPRVTGLL